HARASTSYDVSYLAPPRPVCCGNGVSLEGDVLIMNHAALDAISRIDVSTGTLLSPLAGEDDDDAEELVTPDDQWRDPATGDLYVTEILTNGVRKIAPDGARRRVMSGFGDGVAHPNAITGLRRPGAPLRLFISMVSFEPASRTGIWEVDPAGLVPPQLVYGAAGGQVIYERGLRAPNAMAFDPAGKELYVPESYGGAVWAIDVDAHTARRVYAGRPDGKANGIALRFARDGESILYAEQDSGRLLRLDPDGPPEQEPGVVAQLDPGIDGIAEHADGRIFLSNFRFGGLAVVLPGAEPRAVEQMFTRSLDLPNGISRRSNGDIVVGDLGSMAVVADGAIARPKQFIRDDFDIAVGVHASPQSCLAYATGFFRGSLQEVDLCDEAKPHREVVPRRTFVAPWDIAAGAGTSMYVTDIAQGTVWLVAPDGSAPPRVIAAGLVTPTGIAVATGPLGRRSLFVSETDAGHIRMLDAETGMTIGILDGLAAPEGIAIDGDGSLVVVEAGAGRLTRVRTDGGREALTGIAPDVRGVGVLQVLNFFADVEIDEMRRIYVTSPRDGSLMMLTPQL
ncbi:MAG TPA: hypothetical protein VM600_09540, partial [Actinomycetota bacterium]|nr:hypothetical protein [Actinomycetota bacterium]